MKISLKTAKLAKEAGFDQKLEYDDFDSSLYCYAQHRTSREYRLVSFVTLNNTPECEQYEYAYLPTYYAPEQADLQAWLREEKGIHIDLLVEPDIEDGIVKDIWYRGFIWEINKPEPQPASDLGCSRYEKILETCLKEALTFLCKKSGK